MKNYTKKDYYKEIDKALKSYEENKPWHLQDMSWISDRIDWCWKWKKITKEQKDELCERTISLFKEGRC